MATLGNKRKLAVVKRETQAEHPRNGQSRNTSVPRINEEHMTQVSEDIVGRVTKKLSQELSMTESCTWGALSKLDEFLLNPQIQPHSRTVPGTFPNTSVENQGLNEGDSQSDLHPEAGIFRSRTTQNSGPDVRPEMVTGGSKEIRNGHDMVTLVTEDICNRHDIVTGVQEEIGYRPHMLTGVREEIPFCSPGTSSGKQKKARSTSQPQFPSDDTPETIEADQIFLALREQLRQQ